MGPTTPGLASQAAWHRMENSPKAENGKNLAKKREWPTAPNEGKPHNGAKVKKEK